jgi:hypothetical protein
MALLIICVELRNPLTAKNNILDFDKRHLLLQYLCMFLQSVEFLNPVHSR